MDEPNEQTWTPPPDWTREHRLIWDLGYFGHYLHLNGGRSGQKRIVMRLAKHGGSMDQRELQGAFDISSGSLSEVLAKLEAEGLVKRSKSEEDARRQVVSLTKDGLQAAEEERRRSEEFEQSALSVLTDGERDQLLEMLNRLIAHWNHLDCTVKKQQ